jgi:hypothetical protein
LISSQKLAVDGIFGSFTHQSVLQYQRGVSIAADGIVGKRTWYHLLKGDKVTIPQTFVPGQHAASGSVVAPKGRTVIQALRVASPTVPADSIWEWPLDRKLIAVVERVPKRLPRRARDEFLGLLHLESLALSLAIIAGFCLLSGGTALVLGAIVLGLDVMLSLIGAVLTAAYAATEQELDEAADQLAHIVLAIGVAVFIKSVGEVVKSVKGAGKVVAEPPPESAPVTTAPERGPEPRQRIVEETDARVKSEGVGAKEASAPKGVSQPTVTDPKLQNLVNDLYKGAKTDSPIGTGSTADAIREELATGQKVGGRFHTQKGQEYARALQKWIEKNPNASTADKTAAQQMLNDLLSALEGK